MAGSTGNPSVVAGAFQQRIAEGLRLPPILPLDVAFSGSFSGEPPREVERALVGAAREALHNAQRHAGVEEARVLISASPTGTVTVVVSDDGSGFDSGARAGVGRRESISRAMDSVGGVAMVNSAVGSGTTVTLTWSPQTARGWWARETARFAREHAATLAVVKDERHAHIKVLAAAVAANLYIMARYVGQSHRPALSLALALLLSAATVALLDLADRRPLTPLILVGWSVFTGAVVSAELSFEPAGALANYHSWMIGVASVSAAGLSFTVPLWAALLPSAAIDGAVAARLVGDPTIGATHGVNAMVFIPAMTLFGWLVGGAFRRSGRLVGAARSRAVQAEVAREERAAREAARGLYLSNASAELVPFLSGLLRDHRRFEDPDARAEAERLMVRARDDLHFPGQLNEDLRCALDTARARGVVIELRATNHDQRPSPALVRVLGAVLPLTEDRARVVVHSDSATGRPPYLTVIPGLPAQHAGLLVAAATDHVNLADDSPELTVLEVPEPSNS